MEMDFFRIARIVTDSYELGLQAGREQALRESTDQSKSNDSTTGDSNVNEEQPRKV